MDFNKDLLKSLKSYIAYRKGMFHPKADTPISMTQLSQYHQIYSKIDPAILSEIFKKHFGATPNEVKKIEVKSTFHDLYLVTLREKQYVLKINSLNQYYYDASFYIEAYMQEKLRKLKLPSVAVKVIDISRKVYPFDYMIMSYQKGTNLEQYEGKNQIVLYKQLGKIFKKIHSLQTFSSGQINIISLFQKQLIQGENNSWSDFFYSRLKDHLNKAYKLKVINKKEKQFINKIFKDNLPIVESGKFSLLHNDPGLRNIIANGKIIVGILDWEDAIVGDPLWEIANIHSFLFRDKDKIKFENFCRGYNLPGEMLSSKKYWLYYLRVMLMKVAGRYIMGYYNNQGIIIDRHRIQESLQQLAYFCKNQ